MRITHHFYGYFLWGTTLYQVDQVVFTHLLGPAAAAAARAKKRRKADPAAGQNASRSGVMSWAIRFGGTVVLFFRGVGIIFWDVFWAFWVVMLCITYIYIFINTCFLYAYFFYPHQGHPHMMISSTAVVFRRIIIGANGAHPIR